MEFSTSKYNSWSVFISVKTSGSTDMAKVSSIKTISANPVMDDQPSAVSRNRVSGFRDSGATSRISAVPSTNCVQLNCAHLTFFEDQFDESEMRRVKENHVPAVQCRSFLSWNNLEKPVFSEFAAKRFEIRRRQGKTDMIRLRSVFFQKSGYRRQDIQWFDQFNARAGC